MNYKRIIGLSDIHGEFRLLKDLIENEIVFAPRSDMLIVLGDYIDRSLDSKLVVEYIKTLKGSNPEQVVLLRGNHEELAYFALTKAQGHPYLGDPMKLWLINGGQATIDSFGGVAEAREILVPFIEQLQLYYETETHIFVHSGIPKGKTLKTATPHELLWNRDLDYQGEKIVVVGHTAQRKVTKKGNVICIDTAAYATGKLSAYDCLSGKIYEATEKTDWEISLRQLRKL